MAKQKRDNDYYLGRLEKEHPAVFEDLQNGKFRTPREAFVAVGYKKQPSGLDKLENAWKSAKPNERADFLDRIGARHTGRWKRADVVDLSRRLTLPAIHGVARVMAARTLSPGDMMSELGFSRHDQSIRLAMRGSTTIQENKVVALVAWLNKYAP